MRVLSLWVVLSASLALWVGCGSDDAAPDSSVDGGVDGSLPGDASMDATDGSGLDGGGLDGAADGGDADAGPYMGPRAVAIAAFGTRACSILEDGALRCWGDGVAAPETIMAGTAFVHVALGEADGGSTCGVTIDGALHCWTTDEPTPVLIEGGPYREAAIGRFHRCALDEDGAIFCWGRNSAGQLGLGVTDPDVHPTPAQVGVDTDWATLAAGETHTCALKVGGDLHCWGSSQAIRTPDFFSSTPAEMRPGETFTDIALHEDQTCAVRADGALFCGTGTEWPQAGTATNWAQWGENFSDGRHAHGCGVTTEGALLCEGFNTFGQAGLVESAPSGRVSLMQIGAAGEYTDLAVAHRFTCAIHTDGSVRCFGRASLGQLGYGGPALPRAEPTQVGAAGEWSQLSANQGRTCGVRVDGSMACWGSVPPFGWEVQVPTAADVSATIPPRESWAGGDWAEVHLGLSHTCAKKSDASLHCWGNNGSGQLGAGATPALAFVPVAVGFTAKAVSLGMTHTCAIDMTDHLYCWGLGLFNRLGFAADSVSTPTQVGSDTWRAVAASNTNTCGIRADGTLHCWGFSFTDIEEISSDTTWTAIATTPNDNEYFGIKAGVPHKWSGNGGSRVPTPLGSAAGWVSFSANYGHQCGVRTDGTLECLGINRDGELGAATPEMEFMTPIRVGTATDWTSVAVGYTHSCGIRAGGTVFCWGRNHNGEIGDGTSWSAVPRIAAL